jgi:hypothetical protein
VRKEKSQRNLDSLKLEVIDSANLMRTLLRSLVCLLLASASAQAQAVSTAQINGTVKDSGGLPLPGVTVTMTQTDTGLVRDTVTIETGAYVITNLPVGPLQAGSLAAGFSAPTRRRASSCRSMRTRR